MEIIKETDGTFDGVTVICPTCAFGDCPYCDECDICHCANPADNCDDFGAYYESMDDYVGECYAEVEQEAYDECEDWNDECGFDPYLGCYTDDC